MNMNNSLSRLISTINKYYNIDGFNDLLIDINYVNAMLLNGFNQKVYNRIFNKYLEEINYLRSLSNNSIQPNNNIDDFNRLLNLKYTLVIIIIRRYLKEVSIEQLKSLLNESGNKQIEIIEFIANSI